MTGHIETHIKKRLEIIIEAPMLSRLIDLLDRLAVTGYTVIPALAGRGRGGPWREGPLSQAGQMVVVVCITDPARIDELLEPLYKLLARQIGIISVADVAVIRSDHF